MINPPTQQINGRPPLPSESQPPPYVYICRRASCVREYSLRMDVRVIQQVYVYFTCVYVKKLFLAQATPHTDVV